MTTSPVFVAHFIDGTVTRMTTYVEGNKLDMARGVLLSRHAYHQRHPDREVPALVQAHFERGDQVLENYNAIELANGGVAPETKGGAPTQAKSDTK